MAQVQNPWPIFSDAGILAYANTLLAKAGTPTRVTTLSEWIDNCIVFYAPKRNGGVKKVAAPYGSPRPGLLFFRSLLQVTDPRRGGTWLCNGQASTGTKEIAFFGESGPWLAADLASVERHIQTRYVNVRDDRKAWADQMIADSIAEARTSNLFGAEVDIVEFHDGAQRRPLALTTSGQQLCMPPQAHPL